MNTSGSDKLWIVSKGLPLLPSILLVYRAQLSKQYELSINKPNTLVHTAQNSIATWNTCSSNFRTIIVGPINLRAQLGPVCRLMFQYKYVWMQVKMYACQCVCVCVCLYTTISKSVRYGKFISAGAGIQTHVSRTKCMRPNPTLHITSSITWNYQLWAACIAYQVQTQSMLLELNYIELMI